MSQSQRKVNVLKARSGLDGSKLVPGENPALSVPYYFPLFVYFDSEHKRRTESQATAEPR
jgi:hypothetical protein